jgi:hypothetical protein
MDIGVWLSEHVFDLLSAVGIIGGLVFTAVSFRSEAKTRRVANLLTLTHNHRELWKVFYRNLDFSRILDASSDIKSLPVNQGEQVYVNALIQHLSSVFRAMQTDLTIKPKGVRRDVRAFFALPIPRAVWEKLKPFQDADFVAFVEDCLRASS